MNIHSKEIRVSYRQKHFTEEYPTNGIIPHMDKDKNTGICHPLTPEYSFAQEGGRLVNIGVRLKTKALETTQQCLLPNGIPSMSSLS